MQWSIRAFGTADMSAPSTTAAVRIQCRSRRLPALLRDPGGVIGLAIVILLVVCAVFADVIAPYGPLDGDLADARRPPAWEPRGVPEHLLGTDQLGQDIFSRIIHGSRVSLTVGFFGALLAAFIGVTLGLIAGYFGGWADAIISSFVNVLLSLPYVVLVIVIATIFGRSLLNVILIFGVTGSPIFVRLTRGETLRLKNEEYVQAAQALGAGPGRVLFCHILPNMIGVVITLATFEMSAMILYESGLSFLGLSVPPQVPSWGNMLALGRQFLPVFPWMSIYPGLAIALTALGVNLLGDRLREIIDPRLRQKR
jgi:ABC-type dipeptide/oligopeptide/nickel transport system permease subunit